MLWATLWLCIYKFMSMVQKKGNALIKKKKACAWCDLLHWE